MITITCDCNKTYQVERTEELPESVHSIGCNFCPVCEGSPINPWKEWWLDKDGNKIEQDERIELVYEGIKN